MNQKPPAPHDTAPALVAGPAGSTLYLIEIDHWKNRALAAESRLDEAVNQPTYRIRQEQAERIAELESRLDSILGMHDPWPLADVLNKLADGVTHMLRVHGCDTHGHEEYSRARDRALELRAAILSGAVERQSTK